jgi:hypothetical protein
MTTQTETTRAVLWVHLQSQIVRTRANFDRFSETSQN